MATKTEQLLSSVKFNKLTKTQYDAAILAGQISPTEFYCVEENATPNTIRLTGKATSIPVNLDVNQDIEIPVSYIDMAKQNLLDNSNFKNPVNQGEIPSGQIFTIIIQDIFLDRWKAISGQYAISSLGLNLINGKIQQRVAFVPNYFYNKNFSASVEVEDSSSGTATASYDATTKIFTITTTGSPIITWAKLEVNDTPTPYIPKTYSDELNACRLWRQRLKGNSSITSLGQYIPIGLFRDSVTGSTCNAYFNISPMAKTPTVICVNCFMLNFIPLSVVAISYASQVMYSKNSNILIVQFALASSLTQATLSAPCVRNSDGYLELKCEPTD